MKNFKDVFRLILRPQGHKIYFIGIGGISMSGLARMLQNAGAIVSGSDMCSGIETEKLEDMGIHINYVHDANNIDDTIDVIIYSGAIHRDNPEICQAARLDIPTIERSVLLGIISRQYRRIISVAGTHGKTTTTAMIGWIFSCAGLNPTIHLGGESIDLDDNTIIGSTEYLILEACEYRESFKYLRSHTAIITNIELDHADYYRDIDDIRASFNRFAMRAQNIITFDGDISHPNTTIIGRDYSYTIDHDGGYYYIFCLTKNGHKIGVFKLNMIGQHNVANATIAIVTALHYGIDIDTIKRAIESFSGVRRRYENIGDINGVPIIIDYAHHPTEIACSINGIKNVFPRFLTIFQPHTYSRTIALFDDFVRVLSDLSALIMFETYPARESVIEGGEASDLYLALKPYISDLQYTEDVHELMSLVEKHRHVDAILLLGAGNLADIIKKTINKE